MKKTNMLLAAVLTVLLVLAFTGCGSDDSDESGDGDSGEDGDGDNNGENDGDSEETGEDVWCDPSNNLCWQNPQPELTKSSSDAVTYCENLTWATFTNWRLPTISELRTIVEGCEGTATGGFCGVTDTCRSQSDQCYSAETCAACESGSDCYRPAELAGDCNVLWSATEVEGADSKVWQLDFEDAAIAASATSELLAVRCVRFLPEEDGDEEADGDADKPADGDDSDGDIDSECMGDYDFGEISEDAECAPYESMCEDDTQYQCVGGKWEFNFDCYESWMTCIDGENCESYPDCESATGEICWGERALHCVEAGMDWQLHDDCADWDFMTCADGYCTHDSGPTFLDSAAGLEWQWLIYPLSLTDQFGTWAEANSACSDLTLDGKSDWRLPTISELRTLIGGCPGSEDGGSCNLTDSCTAGECYTEGCYGCEDYEGPIGDMYFRDDAELLYEADHMSYTGEFWSSTNCTWYTEHQDDYAFYVDYDSGTVEDDMKTMPSRYRCVRDLAK